MSENQTIATNSDRLIGKIAIVTKEIVEDGKGQVKVEYQNWPAITKDTGTFKVGEKVLYLNGCNEWCEGIIDKMRWDENINTLYYYINSINGTNIGRATTRFLKPMKQKELKDYLKPGYVVEYDDGDRCLLTQDILRCYTRNRVKTHS